MNDRYIKLQIESIVNKILYQNKVIEENMFRQTAEKLDKLIFQESEKQNKTKIK